MDARTNDRRPTDLALPLTAALLALLIGRAGLALDPGDRGDRIPDPGRDPIDPPVVDDPLIDPDLHDPIIDDPIRRPSGDPIIKLTLHPRAAEILNGVVQGLSQKRINVALLGGEKFMISDCLGLKVSAGEFDLQLGHSTFSLGASGVELEFAIDHVSVSALRFRMQPRANLLSPCDWSEDFGTSGSVKDIRITARFDPRLHLDGCYMTSLGAFEARVSIGDVNLSNVQNDLEQAAKNLVEDSVTMALNLFLPSLLSEALNGSFLNGLCMTKLELYEAYMAYLGMGVNLHRLPEEYIEGLQPFYPTVDLRNVRFGYSDHQPPHNATTDCDRMYFNDREYVERLRDAALEPDDWYWVFHELEHTEQCAQLGSRVEYAKTWFHDFETSLLVLNLGNPASLYDQLHDNMPMDQDAFAKEDRIGVIEGVVVVHGSTQPAPGVEVTAVVAGEVEAADTSGSAGGFRLFVAPGTCDLHVRAPGAAESVPAAAGFTVEGRTSQTVILELPADGTPSLSAFIRGDANRSGGVNISDALATLGWLFTGAVPASCLDASDVTDDGTVNIADPLALLNHLFSGGLAPRAPFPGPGADPTADGLPCSI
jgi:hypothetical protein